MNQVVNIDQKLTEFSEFWTPKIVGDLNEQQVKLAKLKGEFVWHSHKDEDEMFLVIKGELKIEFESETKHLSAGEFLIIPKGQRHRPVADEEVHVLLFEPKSTLNTGDQQNHFTKNNLDKI
ncbi:cupin domain-containing protein [Psychroflexus aestuariivivens]|uniref:cupin domain-containing protein n=1 Tax=Psychroflexus aestuariivivens TaxID=1795040 RepID=UPI000FDBE4E5|nr:cupin domain-containing protein [Psychroflexus aestuariivivens]